MIDSAIGRFGQHSDRSVSEQKIGAGGMATAESARPRSLDRFVISTLPQDSIDYVHLIVYVTDAIDVFQRRLQNLFQIEARQTAS